VADRPRYLSVPYGEEELEFMLQPWFDLDIVELQSKIGRDPSERAPREAREPREPRGERHTPQFLQRPTTAPARAPAGAGAIDDEFDED